MKVELTGGGEVKLGGNGEFHGLLIIRLKSGWSGANPAFTLHGTPQFKGVIYVEADTLGTSANAAKELLNLSGGGAVVNVRGAFYIDVRDEAAAAFAQGTKKVAHLSGGGSPGQRNYVFSSAGVNLARQVMQASQNGQATTTTTTTWRVVAREVTGAVRIAQ